MIPLFNKLKTSYKEIHQNRSILIGFNNYGILHELELL